MIKLLIFDLGKVIFNLSFERVFLSWSRSSGKPIEHIKQNFSFTGAYEKFETGEIAPALFRSQVSYFLDISINDELFDKGWCDLYLEVYPQVKRLLPMLKQQFRLVALTNTNVIHEPVWRSRYSEVLNHFEKIYSSHELGLRKPDPLIYSHVLSETGINPYEALFLDDNLGNVKSAEACGIKSILVNDPDQMIKDLNTIINQR
jgi:putative hydrolase of the HAD superfamily